MRFIRVAVSIAACHLTRCEEIEFDRKSNELIIGYFIYQFNNSVNVKLLMKLLGLISLRAFESNKEFSITIYSFYGDTYIKKTLCNVSDVIDFFSMGLSSTIKSKHS